MKARNVWLVIAALLVAGVAYKVSEVRKQNATVEERKSEAALIRAAKVSRADMAERIAVTGTIRPRNEVDVFAKVPGRIESLNANIGDTVRAGQTLAVIEHKEIGWQAKASQASLDVAKANLAGAKLEHDRTLSMFKGGAAPQAQVDGVKVRMALAEAQVAQAEAAAGLATQQLENARVESPIAGTVIRRPVNLGAQVGPQAPLYTIQDVAILKMESSVDAQSFVRLQKGREAVVTVDAFPGETFPGKVTLLSPSLDPVTRRASVEIEIDNASGRLLPNMFAHADIAVGQMSMAIVVPRAAVYETAGGARVFRVHGNKVEAVTPKLGPGDEQRLVVIDGLAEGDEVAISGLPDLADGSEVKVAPATAALGAH